MESKKKAALISSGIDESASAASSGTPENSCFRELKRSSRITPPIFTISNKNIFSVIQRPRCDVSDTFQGELCPVFLFFSLRKLCRAFNINKRVHQRSECGGGCVRCGFIAHVPLRIFFR
ncbi:Hypothetical protein c1489 [Escherichia coli CFT073]|uniref:Uncharacterized protein n=1 Tax=Escherichia coli O6:H1 (strain CFT073 / ATCC 700928 / UPEC) TaxID=199310 RepID=A0A0H2V6P5_ECOL6|nr:Hypothetical protein c1489 [Escherichia coli CFT073]